MSIIQEEIADVLYSSIYVECTKSYDKIIQQYPTFLDDTKKSGWIKKLDNIDNMTDEEIVAHAYTTMVMTYIFCGMMK